LTDKKKTALDAIVRKFSLEYIEKGTLEIQEKWDFTEVIEVKIEHLAAKGSLR
jgi:hypothetical protein